MDIPVDGSIDPGGRPTAGRDGVEIHRRVVVGLDGSPGSRAALRCALTMAARRGAELEVVSTYPVPLFWAGEFPVDLPESSVLQAATESRLREVLAEVRQDPAVLPVTGVDQVAVSFHVSAGSAAPTLLDRAERADVLVVGSRGRGSVRSVLLGSVALHCVTHGRGPVVVVHDRSRQAGGSPTVVVGVDGSARSRAALTSAVEEASRLGAEVEVVAVHDVTNYWVDAYPAAIPTLEEIRTELRSHVEALVAQVLGELATTLPAPLPTVRTVITEGSPARTLVERSEGADLLVVGGARRGALRGLLVGSVALSAALHAPCPVMIVHGRAHERPGTAARSSDAVTARG